MESDKLKRANELKKEIHELDSFLFVAEKVWSGKVTIKDKIMSVISNAYGYLNSKEFNLNTEMKNRVLDLLIEYKKELEKEFDEI